jgi:Ankyrin repeats (many copies)
MPVVLAGSRPLPERPNLEHLRNEAKARLKALRATASTTTLAGAQRTVAGEYGFSSWRSLKAYVDAVNDLGERLIQAVRSGDLTTIRVALDQCPQLVNCTTDRQERLAPSDTLAMRLIHLAVSENQLDVAHLLIDRGADLNVRNGAGRLPLHDSFELGRDEFFDMLLTAGAEPDASAAAARGMLDHLTQILERDPRQANDLTTGESPLGWSAYGHQPEAARLLLRHGAIISRPPYDWYAWRAATLVGATTVARVFLEHGADPNCQNDHGDTPLHTVIRSRIVADPVPFVEALLDHQADPSHRNHAGLTALDIALEQSGKWAETYFPIRPDSPKHLEPVIDLLRRTSS